MSKNDLGEAFSAAAMKDSLFDHPHAEATIPISFWCGIFGMRRVASSSESREAASVMSERESLMRDMACGPCVVWASGRAGRPSDASNGGRFWVSKVRLPHGVSAATGTRRTALVWMIGGFAR
jgi:hypothetical protein